MIVAEDPLRGLHSERCVCLQSSRAPGWCAVNQPSDETDRRACYCLGLQTWQLTTRIWRTCIKCSDARSVKCLRSRLHPPAAALRKPWTLRPLRDPNLPSLCARLADNVFERMLEVGAPGFPTTATSSS